MSASGDRSETKFSRRLEFAKDATLDLRSIVRYTRRTWGDKQQVRYAGRLSASMQELLSHPHLGSARDDIGPDIRNLHVGQHVIYYRVLASSIRIVRILHARMNAEEHLRGRS